MKIRKATIADSSAIAHIQVDSYRTAYAPYVPQAYLDHFTYEAEEQDWRGLLSSATADLLFVAEDEEGEVVGYALGRPSTDTSKPYAGTLAALNVRQSEQQQGFGRVLLAAVAGALHASGCASL